MEDDGENETIQASQGSCRDLKHAALRPLRSSVSNKHIYCVQQLPKCWAGNAQNISKSLTYLPSGSFLSVLMSKGEFKGSEKVFLVEGF